MDGDGEAGPAGVRAAHGEAHRGMTTVACGPGREPEEEEVGEGGVGEEGGGGGRRRRRWGRRRTEGGGQDHFNGRWAPIEVEAASIMTVLKDFDVRFGRGE